jgi:hypothetical protein
MEPAIAPREKFNLRDRIILTLLIAIVTFGTTLYLSTLTGPGLGDLRYSLGLAREWLAGHDPYLPFKLNIDPNAVPYPFTAVLITMPIVWLPNQIAAGLFNGIGAGLLAWLIFKNRNNWQLLMFASWPFVNSVMFYQWSPYIVSMFFTPNLLPFLFAKPQLALPFVLTQRPSRIGIILAGILVIVSVALYPLWPLDWIKTLHNYIGAPPLFVLPLGPLLFLALIRYREKRSWLLVLMALMPQRMVYDQLGVLLVAENSKQMLFLVLCSWISLPAVLYFGGWGNVPWGWKTWVLICSYLPALVVILLPTFKSVSVTIRSSIAKKLNQSSV